MPRTARRITIEVEGGDPGAETIELRATITPRREAPPPSTPTPARSESHCQLCTAAVAALVVASVQQHPGALVIPSRLQRPVIDVPGELVRESVAPGPRKVVTLDSYRRRARLVG